MPHKRMQAAVAGGQLIQPTVVYDGHRFGPSAAAMLPLLHLARLARAGDRAASQSLDAFGVEIEDADGKRYYPPETPELTTKTQD